MQYSIGICPKDRSKTCVNWDGVSRDDTKFTDTPMFECSVEPGGCGFARPALMRDPKNYPVPLIDTHKFGG